MSRFLNYEKIMSIKIYSCNDSRGLRPMWTAEEMGVSYESEMMPFPPRFLHKEYMDVNIPLSPPPPQCTKVYFFLGAKLPRLRVLRRYGHTGLFNKTYTNLYLTCIFKFF